MSDEPSSDAQEAAPRRTPAARAWLSRPLHALMSAVPILAPVVLGAGGFYLNARQNATDERIKAYHTTSEQMDATSKYFAYLTDPQPAKAKMGAYAIYMLNRENPELAVSLILAPERKELISVLRDLAFRDSLVRQRLVARQVQAGEGGNPAAGPVQETAGPTTDAARSADEVLRAVPRAGWSYIGNFNGVRWTYGPMMELPQGRLQQGDTYRSRVRLTIRASAPDSATYAHGVPTGVIAPGEMVRVDTLRRNIAGQHVWAHVTVLPGDVPVKVEASAPPR